MYYWTARVRLYAREDRMAWEKPEFEVFELCEEITCYVYHR
jgi:hypothetical protein